MPKHNQSASLGTLVDFTSTPQTPEERLERIEIRLENIEKLLNTVLYAVTDLNETFDKVSKQPQFKKQSAPSKAKKPAQAKQKPKPKPVNQTESSDILNPSDTECLQFTRDYLSDGQKMAYWEIFTNVTEKHEVSRNSVKRVLKYLEQTKEVTHSFETIDDKKVGFIQLAKDK